MRISDWSSDVCSSDLSPPRPDRSPSGRRTRGGPAARWRYSSPVAAPPPRKRQYLRFPPPTTSPPPRLSDRRVGRMPFRSRSEEHTSELQSLMRISYAVFCLQKKNKNKNEQYHYTHTSCAHIHT